jgi:hypothetical protein
MFHFVTQMKLIIAGRHRPLATFRNALTSVLWVLWVLQSTESFAMDVRSTNGVPIVVERLY